MLVGNKVELSRIPRSRFFLAVSSSSLFVCHMLPWIHPSALSIKDFYFCCYCDCLYLEAFSFGCLSFTAHSSWGKPTGGRLEKQDINLTSWVYSFIVWSDFMRRKHMVVEERNCWGVNVSLEMPLLASWQGRKKERKKKPKTSNYGGFVKTQWWKRSQGRLSGRELNSPLSRRGQLSQRTHLTRSIEEHHWVSAQPNKEFDN